MNYTPPPHTVTQAVAHLAEQISDWLQVQRREFERATLLLEPGPLQGLLLTAEHARQRAAAVACELARLNPRGKGGFDLCELFEELIPLLGFVVGRRVPSRCKPAARPLWVHGDRALLREALLELAFLARENPCGSPALEVELNESGASLTLSMLNALHDQRGEALFDVRPNRWGPANTPNLGLVLLKNAMDHCKGELHVESDSPGGPRVVATFPRVEHA
jgi:hypothetical protein